MFSFFLSFFSFYFIICQLNLSFELKNPLNKIIQPSFHSWIFLIQSHWNLLMFTLSCAGAQAPGSGKLVWCTTFIQNGDIPMAFRWTAIKKQQGFLPLLELHSVATSLGTSVNGRTEAFFFFFFYIRLVELHLFPTGIDSMRSWKDF